MKPGKCSSNIVSDEAIAEWLNLWMHNMNTDLFFKKSIVGSIILRQQSLFEKTKKFMVRKMLKPQLVLTGSYIILINSRKC
jgi:hypothetical protein